MDWVKEGVNYWENPDCPREYLEGALVRLVRKMEEVELPIDYFKNHNEDDLRERVSFYEYVADK